MKFKAPSGDSYGAISRVVAGNTLNPRRDKTRTGRWNFHRMGMGISHFFEKGRGQDGKGSWPLPNFSALNIAREKPPGAMSMSGDAREPVSDPPLTRLWANPGL
jgi:hypothetical protein